MTLIPVNPDPIQVNTNFKSEQSYVKHLTDEINNVDVCDYLPKLMEELVAKYEAQLTAVMKEQNVLSNLIIKPTNLAKIITWIGDFIDDKLVGPYGKLVKKYAELGVSYAQLAKAIASKVGELTCLVNPVCLVDFGGQLIEYTVSAVGAAVISQVTIGSIQAYRLSALNPGDMASMAKGLTGLTDRFNVNMGANFNALSTVTSGGMKLSFIGDAVKSIVHIDSNGILTDNGGVLTRVYSGDMQAAGVFQNLKFTIDQTTPGAATIAGSLNGTPIFADAAISSEVGIFTPAYEAQVSTDDTQTTNVDVLHMTINNMNLSYEPVTAVNTVGPNFGDPKFASPMMKW